MTTVNIRKQGGAAVVTIPAGIMKQLDLAVGATLELEVKSGALIARPSPVGHRRYSVGELLEGVTPAVLKKMREESADWHAGESQGRELP